MAEHVSYTSHGCDKTLERATNFGSQSEREDMAMRMAVCGRRSRGTEGQMCCSQEAERER